jgi:hypothetical protein
MSLVAAVAVYTSCAAVDLASTEFAVQHGWVEKNPIGLMHSTGGRLVLKSAQVVALTVIDHEVSKRSKRAARWIRVATIAIHLAVAAHNFSARR